MSRTCWSTHENLNSGRDISAIGRRSHKSALSSAILKAAEFIGMLTGMDADKATYEATEAFVGELRARVKADAAKEDVEVEECNPEQQEQYPAPSSHPRLPAGCLEAPTPLR